MPMNLDSTSNRSSDSSFIKIQYFQNFTVSKALVYLIVVLYVVGAFVVSVLELFMALPCDTTLEEKEFENPAFDANPCRQMRYVHLLGLTPEECGFVRRLVAAIALGSIIGWERRQADRPAGIRTMAVVSLGSCLFTINSAFAFLDGPMSWDASRVSAAIPSGVGFLGAGLIFKKEEKNDDGSSSHVVHGLTTAASLWLSAAVGIACGGELYFPATFGSALVMVLLRFGPRHAEVEDDDEDEDEARDSFNPETKPKDLSYQLTDSKATEESTLLKNSARSSMMKRNKRTNASLASVV